MRHLIPLFFCSILLSACSSDPQQDDKKYSWRYGEEDAQSDFSDADQSQDLGDSPDMDTPDMSAPDLKGLPPRVEVIRYRRQYKDCSQSTCLTEIQFGMRSGIVSRIQSNSITGRQQLKMEDYVQLNALVQTPDFVDYAGQISCPEPVEDDGYTVLLTIELYIDGQDIRHVHDVTGCYGDTAYEVVDDVLSFSETIFNEYYK